MSSILLAIIVFMAILVVFQAIGSQAPDVSNRPGVALARVVLAFVLQGITVALAVLWGIGA